MMLLQNTLLPAIRTSCSLPTWFLVGIGGSGMRSFAEMLADAGNRVIGTDQDSQVCFANSRYVEVTPWNQEPDWNRWPTPIVVYSLAVSPLAPILVDAVRHGLAVLSLPQALSAFLRQTRQICVAGTHGKTTTSAMIWWILSQAGKRPAGFVGGEICSETTAGTFGSGQVSVVESCEYRESFLCLSPQSVILTGIEPDHFDYFQDDHSADQAFRRFVEKVPLTGTVIVNGDCDRAMNAAHSVHRPIVSYSLSGNSDWSVTMKPYAVKTDANRRKSTAATMAHLGSQSFNLCCFGRLAAEVTIPVPGLHNVSNAVAAIIAARTEGIPVEQAASLISTFPGVRRRFEHRGTWNGIDLIDDYAHHPTAVKATLTTARSVFPRRRILAVFEPHQISRTQRLFDNFADALALADECMILPVLPARESASSASCCRLAGQLVRRISQSGGRAFLLANLDQVRGRLDHSGRPGDVVVTMGAGRTHLIHDEIHRRLRRDSAA